MKLPSVFRWLLGQSRVSPHGGHVLPHSPHVDEWTPPPARDEPPRKHIEALTALFQSEGKTGAVPHWEWVDNYAETAWVNGFRQLPERTLLRHLGLLCVKVRPLVQHDDGKWKRAVCYVVPDVPRGKARLSVIPNGNAEDIPWPEMPKRARTGTSHAQA
jgi:hypothetical protein